MSGSNYSAVTEKPGDRVTREALAMVYTRYRFALDYCRGKRVLEVACGEGVGLEYLARQADQVVGGDLTWDLLVRARRSGTLRRSLVQLGADALPFHAASQDVILCYEAVYYFERPLQMLQDCRRVLAPNGLLILCSVNPEWSDFNPSPQSRQYLSAGRLASLAEAAGFRTELLGAFSTESPGPKATMVSWLKRTAVVLHLIPSTMRGKRLLKRLFLGELVSFPSAVEDGLAPYCPPVSIDSRRPVTDYKVLFALCRPR